MTGNLDPNAILGMQHRKIGKLEQAFSGVQQVLANLRGEMGSIKVAAENSQRRLELYKQASDFRTAVKAVAAQVLPFYNIINIVIPATTARQAVVLHTSTAGWYFADRIHVSFYPTAGANANTWRPIAPSDPVVATAAGAADIFNFSLEYFEDRTNRARQNDARLIPGDLFFRRDGDGFLLGGDPWAPGTDITVAITPLVAPDNAGVAVITFLGEQCINVDEGFMAKWMQAKRNVGLL
jgi:hypothetical protein